jgi:pimeloyl-ACP methyl ester carboxylesterase
VGALAAMRERPDSTAMLPSLNGLPALVMVGAEDRLTPPARASAMASAIPEARLIVVAGAAHLPTLEQPTVVDRCHSCLFGRPRGVVKLLRGFVRS